MTIRKEIQQIEALTLANKSPSHLQHLEQTTIFQQNEIKRLSQTMRFLPHFEKSKNLYNLKLPYICLFKSGKAQNRNQLVFFILRKKIVRLQFNFPHFEMSPEHLKNRYGVQFQNVENLKEE